MAKNKVPTRPDAPPARVPVREIDLTFLTDAQKAEIREKARAKVEARARLEAEEEFLRQSMDEMERARHPEIVAEMKDIRLDLALYADRVKLDGRDYYHGELYTVTKPVYDVLMECQQATKRHESEIRGEDSTAAFYRRERNLALNWRTGAVTQNGAPMPIRF